MRLRPRLRAAAGIPILAAVLGLAVWIPIPTTGDPPLRNVVDEVQARLPGWHIVRATTAWECAYSVVAACGGRELGFQMVPAHGLPVGDVWIQPDDRYAQDRLREVSDHDVYLVWFEHPIHERSFSCGAELARTFPGSSESRTAGSIGRAAGAAGVPRD